MLRLSKSNITDESLYVIIIMANTGKLFASTVLVRPLALSSDIICYSKAQIANQILLPIRYKVNSYSLMAQYLQ